MPNLQVGLIFIAHHEVLPMDLQKMFGGNGSQQFSQILRTLSKFTGLLYLRTAESIFAFSGLGFLL